MPVLYATHPRFLDHDTGAGHPERPARLRAVESGIDVAGLREALVPVVPQPVAAADLVRVHPAPFTDALAGSPNAAALNWVTLWTNNVIVVTLGNIVGGMFFVGVLYWVAFRKEIAALK